MDFLTWYSMLKFQFVARHLVTIPPGPQLLSDVLISSPILSADRSASIPEELMPGAGGDAAGPSNSGTGFEFGVDPSIDPELAMVCLLMSCHSIKTPDKWPQQALRMSMQEAQAREAAEAASSTSAGASTSAAPTAPAAAAAAPPATTTASAATTVPADPTESEEDVLLKRALAMSEGQDVDMDSGSAPDAMDEDEDEEAAIARAIEMSMKQGEEGEGQTGSGTK